jgi:hypothetical protein
MLSPMRSRALEVGLLLVLVTLLGLRPLIGETLTGARDPVSAGLAELRSPTPLRTLALDIVALAAGSIALVHSAMTGRFRIGAAWLGGIGLFAAACVMSAFFAGEQRPALLAAVDWLAVWVTLLALVSLLHQPWRVGLMLAVLLASGLANVAKCADDRASAAETRARYLENRDRIWTEQGIPLDAPQVRLFEQRMAANEASGFFAHSNVAGGYLLLGLFAALGISLSSPERFSPSVLAGGVLAVGFALGVSLTSSTGALVAGGLGGAVLLARMLGPARSTNRRRSMFATGWLTVVAVTSVVAGWGMLKGGLPHPSLDFRWQYWTASAAMFGDHPWTGVGAENFGNHYTAYKPITSPEEVKNPHNLLVQFATEYGVLGLVAVVALLLIGSWTVLRPAPADSPGNQPWLSPSQARGLWGSALVCAVAIFAVRVPLLESGHSGFILWMTASQGLIWALGAAAAIWGISCAATGAGVARLAAACAVGLLAFLVQDTINFAMFVPSARANFFGLLAVVLAIKLYPMEESGTQPVPAHRKRERTAGAPKTEQRTTVILRSPAAWITAGLAVAGLVFALLQYPPVAAAQRELASARAHARLPLGTTLDAHPAHNAYQRATAADPRDAVAPLEHAQWLHALARAEQSNRAMSTAGASASAADQDQSQRIAALASAGIAACKTGIARSPAKFGAYVRLAQLSLLRGQATNDRADVAQAVAAMEDAIDRYPEYPRNLVGLGNCQIELGTCASAEDAIASYRAALALDARRPAWETFRGFNERESAEIEARVQSVSRFLEDECRH